MRMASNSARQQAINELSQFGITGEMIYLIDIIPLIELCLPAILIHTKKSYIVLNI